MIKKQVTASGLTRLGTVALVGALFPALAGAAQNETSALLERLKQMERAHAEMQRRMEQEIQALRNELSATRKVAQEPEREVQAIEERVATLEKTPFKRKNLLFFRGGYAQLNQGRGNQFFTDSYDAFGLGDALGLPQNDDEAGYYAGAGFDFNLTDDVWGMMPQTSVFAELSVEYKSFESKEVVQPLPTAINCLTDSVNTLGDCNPGDLVTGDVTLTMFSLTASPKIKFFEDGKLRPWIIPVGFGLHVISPPSDVGTVLDIGGHFGAGVDYEFMPGLRAGMDFRYNVTANATDDYSKGSFGNDFWTAGGYVGIGF
jgi:hypothetical protein